MSSLFFLIPQNIFNPETWLKISLELGFKKIHIDKNINCLGAESFL